MSIDQAMGEAARPKLLYFGSRHPAIAPADFPARWRAHGRLGMSLTRWRNVWRYAQCDRIPLAGVPELACDGVATVTFRSEAHRLAHVADPEGAVTRADEAATFAAPVRSRAVLTSSEMLAPPGPGPLRLFVALRRPTALSRDDFHARWRAMGGAVLAALRAVDLEVGLIRNHAVPSDNPLALDGVDEVATRSPATAALALVDLLAGPLRDVVGEALFVATVETVLSQASEG